MNGRDCDYATKDTEKEYNKLKNGRKPKPFHEDKTNHENRISQIQVHHGSIGRVA
jgi:hypothetical protein